jgi:hypothetical protein
MVHVLKNHIIRFLMQLYASKYIHFLHIITILDSLLEGLQGFPTLKQTVPLNIGLKRIIRDYNQGHIIWELRTRGHDPFTKCILCMSNHLDGFSNPLSFGSKILHPIVTYPPTFKHIQNVKKK